MMLIQHSVSSDWLFNTQSSVHQADWFIVEICEEATLNINIPYHLVKKGINLDNYLTTGIEGFAKRLLCKCSVSNAIPCTLDLKNPPIPVELSIDTVSKAMAKITK